jgi:hypothetical protein
VTGGVQAAIARHGDGVRQRFTLARRSAVRKMRQFALARPELYVLELIQAAVGNRAESISFEASSSSVFFSYTGGRLSRGELAYLFDYLFAAKTDLERGHLRDLALGINALMMLQPEELTIKYGDGTLGDVSCMTLRSDTDTIEYERGDGYLKGFFVRATGIERRPAARSAADPPELAAIRERCLAAPVPIWTNQGALFSFERLRVPRLSRYHPAISFDEGDLYGALGLGRHDVDHHFKLLRCGVWIESVESEDPVGGVIGFDRLQKTADSAAFVRDDAYEELWVRVRPYVLRLTGSEQVRTLHDVRDVNSERLEPARLRELLEATERVVACPLDTRRLSKGEIELARRIGHALRGPVLLCPRSEAAALRRIAVGRADVVTPELDETALGFYRKPPAAPPSEPWLAAPLDADPVDLRDVARDIAQQLDQPESSATLLEQLGGFGEARIRLYAPDESARRSRGARVRILLTERVAWDAEAPAAYHGQWLDVSLPGISPVTLRRPPQSGAPTLGDLVVDWATQQSVREQRMLNERALAIVRKRDRELSAGARCLALQAIARGAVVRLRSTGASIAMLAGDTELLDLPLLERLDGRRLSLRRLVRSLGDTGGLVYGVRPDVEANLRGLDVSRIICLDEAEERMLVALLGDGAYVRVDQRDVLAETKGVRCRDIALGLRDYPAFPLLVEPSDSAELEASLVPELVRQLIGRVRGQRPAQPKEPADFPEWEENRRQAVRHLQWLLLTAPDRPAFGADRLPLFSAPDGGVYDTRQVLDAVRSERGLMLRYGRTLGREQLGRLSAATARDAQPEADPPAVLAASPFLHRLLVPLGRVRLSSDFDLTDGEAAANPDTPPAAFLAAAPVSGPGVTGQIGLPAAEQSVPSVVLLDERGKQVATIAAPVAGWVTADNAANARAEVEAEVQRAMPSLVAQLTRRIADPMTNAAARSRMEAVALDWAGELLEIAALPDGRVAAHTLDPTARTVLDLPLFSVGDRGRVSAWQLVREFCSFGAAAFEETHRNSFLPAALRHGGSVHLSWIRRHLDEARVTRLRGTLPPRAIGALPTATQGEMVLPCPQCGAQLRRFAPPSGRQYPCTGCSTQVLFHPVLSKPELHLQYVLAHWIERLRPEAPADRRPTGVVLVEPGQRAGHFRSIRLDEEALADLDQKPDGTEAWLYVNRRHPIASRCLEDRGAAPLAWVLLACYARLNEILEPVTNDHEQVFQRRVAEALLAGELRWVEPAA